jgi:outer membrane protein TolC
VKFSVFSVQCSVGASCRRLAVAVVSYPIAERRLEARRHGLLALAAFLCSTFLAVAATNQPIDLPTALKLAGAQNLDVQIARERLREAEAQRDAAVYNFFPWITPGVGYRRHDGRIQDIVGTVFDASKQQLTPGATLEARLELGDAWFKVLAARQLAKAADHAAAAQQQETVTAAALGYF